MQNKSRSWAKRCGFKAGKCRRLMVCCCRGWLSLIDRPTLKAPSKCASSDTSLGPFRLDLEKRRAALKQFLNLFDPPHSGDDKKECQGFVGLSNQTSSSVNLPAPKFMVSESADKGKEPQSEKRKRKRRDLVYNKNSEIMWQKWHFSETNTLKNAFFHISTFCKRLILH